MIKTWLIRIFPFFYIRVCGIGYAVVRKFVYPPSEVPGGLVKCEFDVSDIYFIQKMIQLFIVSVELYNYWRTDILMLGYRRMTVVKRRPDALSAINVIVTIACVLFILFCFLCLVMMIANAAMTPTCFLGWAGFLDVLFFGFLSMEALLVGSIFVFVSISSMILTAKYKRGMKRMKLVVKGFYSWEQVNVRQKIIELRERGERMDRKMFGQVFYK